MTNRWNLGARAHTGPELRYRIKNWIQRHPAPVGNSRLSEEFRLLINN